ncbi:hypothetical protein [Roseateles flavus]|uniref:Uncharacterized protein n=1 Tax=Roseateles flavus TaxID=3149041 RepID=A0ABV0G9Y3_9BURK
MPSTPIQLIVHSMARIVGPIRNPRRRLPAAALAVVHGGNSQDFTPIAQLEMLLQYQGAFDIAPQHHAT